MGLDAGGAKKRSVLITDVHISGADCITTTADATTTTTTTHTLVG